MGGSASQSSKPEAIKAVRIQTSTYGVVVPMIWGRTRLTGNIIWVGDFTAKKTKGGGK